MRLELRRWPGGPVDEETLRQQLIEEGFDPFRWHDAGGTTYEPHSHAHDESIWLVEGEMTFEAAGQSFHLRPGDRLMLPAGTMHTARVGNSGALYLIGQRPPHSAPSPKPA
ncbi:MAG: hypothetical protein KatS3mg077_2452 [Candidatus Binatia bacterium]|nr:MAG: hypothetical protein KatS3mg077_2452 [Candidatus Binatia bacterium]